MPLIAHGVPKKWPKYTYAEQMDAEGLGRKLLLTPSGDPRRTPEEQTVGTVTASQNMLTLQALSSSLHAGRRCKGRLPEPRRGFWVPSTVSIYTLPFATKTLPN